MKLNKLTKTTTKGQKRIGRGIGSGKGGHTVGRGQKGQKSRTHLPLLFSGTKVRKSLIRRLPMKRGKDRFKSLQRKQVIINVKYLDLLPDGQEVTVASLIKYGLVDKSAEIVGVKILGDGVITKKLTVALPVSKAAKLKIEKAGGKVIEAKKVDLSRAKVDLSREKKDLSRKKVEKKAVPKTLLVLPKKQPKKVKPKKANK